MTLRTLAVALLLGAAAPALAPPVRAQSTAPATVPAAIFVTWDGDPTTTVSIDWHLAAGTDVPALELRGPGVPRWRSHRGTAFPFPHSTRTVRRARIAGLRPGATYEVRIGGSPVYRYRTMPARLTRPVRFAAGGDTQADDARFGATNRYVATQDVDFVLLGGDLAYSNGDPRLVQREETWFETVSRTLVTPERRLLPVIAAIGNHEVFSERDTAPAFRRMMDSTGVTFGEPTYYRALHAHARTRQYGVVDVGDYLSLVLLNTAHTAPVGGAQAEWLRETLAARAAVPHLFPIYHVPGYPSVRSFDGATSAQVRTHWAPLFEGAGVRVAFENHDHAYKRTPPIRAGQRDSSGVVYVGDGAWGAGPRPIGRDHRGEPVWYLERSASVNHGIIVTLDPKTARLEVRDSTGAMVDSVRVTARPRPAAGTRAAVVPAAAPRRPAPRDPAPAVVREAFGTPQDTLDNVDSPAVYHGPDGTHWLLATAKTADAVLVYDAATGAVVRRVGTTGRAPGQLARPNGILVRDSLLLVVERDNHRVQAFRLPGFTPLGTFGDSVLRKPYGLAAHSARPGELTVYVTDSYETPEGGVPPLAALGARVREFSLREGRDGAGAPTVHSSLVRTFGDTTARGALRVVESIAVDPAAGRLLIAEELETDSHVKVYDLAGRYTGRDMGRGLFPQQAEGLALYACGGGAGYWIATDQGRGTNTYHLFDRASLVHVGSFAGARTRLTDGIALTQRAFGAFGAGAFYASHLDGGVSAFGWAEVAAALGVRADCTAEG